MCSLPSLNLEFNVLLRDIVLFLQVLDEFVLRVALHLQQLLFDVLLRELLDARGAAEQLLQVLGLRFL